MLFSSPLAVIFLLRPQLRSVLYDFYFLALRVVQWMGLIRTPSRWFSMCISTPDVIVVNFRWRLLVDTRRLGKCRSSMPLTWSFGTRRANPTLVRWRV
jgi:hypothetical protein